MKQTLAPEEVQMVLAQIAEANRDFAKRFPGDSDRRQPVHTVYGGAQVFRSDTAPRLGALARRSLEEYAPEAGDFARALGLPGTLAATIYDRVAEKLSREPVEDFRIDFEDGYGNRPDAEEDGHAESAAVEVARGLDGRNASALRRNPDQAVHRRAEGARRPHARPLPDRADPRDRRAPAGELRRHASESHGAGTGLRARAAPRPARAPPPPARTSPSVRDHGRDAAGGPRRGGDGVDPGLVGASRRRCVAAHFGTYDYTASLNITAAYQTMTHPACDFAKSVLQVALAGTGVWISDGSTNVLPVPPHRARRGVRSASGGRGEPPGGPRGVEAPLRPRPALARARLLPGVGPPPRAAPDPLRRALRVLPRGDRRGLGAAEELRPEGGPGDARR